MTLRDLARQLKVAAHYHPELVDEPIEFRQFPGDTPGEPTSINCLRWVDGQLYLVNRT